jgi:hypothetical protein
VRRVKRLNPASVPEGQSELFSVWRHHVIFTDGSFVLADAEPMHRDHACLEQVFADLEDSALAHLPSGKFTANAAWLTLAATSYNLTRPAGHLAVATSCAAARRGGWASPGSCSVPAGLLCALLLQTVMNGNDAAAAFERGAVYPIMAAEFVSGVTLLAPGRVSAGGVA